MVFGLFSPVLELAKRSDMRAWVHAERAAGRRIAFVPTMGYLHEGHLRLLDRARALADSVVVSIYVNPLQFGPGEDLARYPRDLERDRVAAAARGATCLFVPDNDEMYPAEPVVRISPGLLGEVLEGAARPGHFSGVLTIVAKLFHAVEPDVAVFGRKDLQQVILVRRLVADLDFPLAVEMVPTVRELDGLALSSRNSYLTPDQRRVARSLSRALREVERSWRAGEADPRVLHQRGLAVLSAPGVEPEYLALVDDALSPVGRVVQTTAALVAARVGTTRLIDNVILGDGVGADPTVGS
jgi:pantoate--beta-alanine ligase